MNRERRVRSSSRISRNWTPNSWSRDQRTMQFHGRKRPGLIPGFSPAFIDSFPGGSERVSYLLPSLMRSGQQQAGYEGRSLTGQARHKVPQILLGEYGIM